MSTDTREAKPTSQRSSKTFIPEIHGLRGIALALVVAFHLFGGGRVSGGVDVFLFISAFLLTGSLLRAADNAVPHFLSARYARTFSRLVPPALLALLAVGVGTVIFLPKSHWYGSFTEIISSALYFENIQLINARLAYGAAGPEASALQHFWSLSLQGQFFILWPLIVALCYLTARFCSRRFGWNFITGRRAVLFVALVTTAASFLWAIYLVRVNQQVAYFSSQTRFWQLGMGALVAIVLTRVRVPSAARNWISWFGVALIMFSGFFIDGLNLYPGPWSLVPLMGVVFVLIGSGASDKYSVGPVLNIKPVKFIADISYGLYLWHWPILVFYLNYRGWNSVGWKGALGILVLSILIATASRRLFEVVIPRIQRKGRWKTLGALALATTLLVSICAYGAYAIDRHQRELLAESAAGQDGYPGGEALRLREVNLTELDPVPALEAIWRDSPAIYDQDCVQNYQTDPEYADVLICDDLLADGDEKLRVILSGGSHVTQWYPAWRELASAENWELMLVEKDGCRLRANEPGFDRENSCNLWNEKAVQTISDLRPDVVFTIATRTSADSPNETVPSASIQVWEELGAAGIPVIAIRDNPRWEYQMPECIESNDGDWSACGKPRSVALPEVNPLLERDDVPANVVPIDLSDVLCDAERCEAVVGNVFVYRDDDHLTSTYVRTLTPALREELWDAAPWLFR